MDGENVSRAVAAEPHLPGAAGFGHKYRHPCQDALESSLQGFDADLYLGLLPQKNVVLEVHWNTRQFEV